MNVVAVMGRLTRAPEVSKTTGGKIVCAMRVAVPRGGDPDGAEFVDVVAYEALGRTCGEYLDRGRRVCVIGRLVHEEWEAADGGRRQRLVIVARDIEFIDAPPTPTDAAPAAAVA